MWKVSYFQGENFPPKLTLAQMDLFSLGDINHLFQRRLGNKGMDPETKFWYQQRHTTVDLIGNWKLTGLNIKEMLVPKLRNFRTYQEGKVAWEILFT